MNTPICDFVREYNENKPLRFHMPGHKGEQGLGFESLDITEIDGADSLYEAEGIIRESEKNASSIFGARTFYSTEGSSQCIKAMLYLMCQKAKKKPLIWAGRNVHKSFLSATVLLDFDIKWLYQEDKKSYLSCRIDAESLKNELEKAEIKPDAVYITSPDYLGNMCDIKSLAHVCHEKDVLLLVDNAHGAYLKFLSPSLFPTDLGADMCSSSAHKTLPVLTGGAYLHISERLASISDADVKTALSLFGSTSPSHLILQSLDMANKTMSEQYERKISFLAEDAEKLKKELTEKGFVLTGDEIFKLTIDAKKYGYTGYSLAELLKKRGIICEFADNDFVVLMISSGTTEEHLFLLKKALFSIEKREEILLTPPLSPEPERIFSPRGAAFCERETIPVSESLGRILAISTVGCPPAVPIIAGGEEINEDVIKCFKYYGIKNCTVIKK